MGVVIRRATAADAEQLERMFAEVVGGLVELYTEQARAAYIAAHDAAHLRELIAVDPDHVWIGEIDGSPVGFSIVERDEDMWWLSWYGVTPAARGGRLGERLIANVLTQAARRGVRKVWCDSRVENTHSNTVLEALGFVRICRVNQHWYGQDYWLWERSVE